MEGISNDQTEAATITPEANPSSAFCRRFGISFFIKKTKADPSAVPAKGIKRAVNMASMFMAMQRYCFFPDLLN